MRKISAYLLMSLDGVVEAPDTFVRDGLFDDSIDVLRETIAEQDAVLLGRKMFEEWSEFWPTADLEPFASFINQHPKYVVSSTLRSVDAWPNSSLIDGNITDRLTALKRQDGDTIGVHGSITLVNSLLSAGLLDELRLTVFPARSPAVAGGCSRTANPSNNSRQGRHGPPRMGCSIWSTSAGSDQHSVIVAIATCRSPRNHAKGRSRTRR
jgi:dihydrofolate reductase